MPIRIFGNRLRLGGGRGGIEMLGGGAAAVPWYLAGGVAAADCVGAYLAKGATSLAASYINLANPGTHDLTATSAPAFNTATGWTFSGASQYLISDITPEANYSAFVQFGSLVFTGVPLCNDQGLFGCYNAGGLTHFTVELYNQTNMVYYANSNSVGVTPILASGNLGFTNRCYRNGTLDSGTALSAVACERPIYIGAKNLNGTPSLFVKGNISAFCIFKIIHPDPGALVAAMVEVADLGG